MHIETQQAALAGTQERTKWTLSVAGKVVDAVHLNSNASLAQHDIQGEHAVFSQSLSFVEHIHARQHIRHIILEAGGGGVPGLLTPLLSTKLPLLQ